MPATEGQESVKHDQLPVEPAQDQDEHPSENVGPNSDEQSRIKSEDVTSSVQQAIQQPGQFQCSYPVCMPAQDFAAATDYCETFLLQSALNKSTSYPLGQHVLSQNRASETH